MGSQYSFQLRSFFSDPDGDTLQYMLEGAPTNSGFKLHPLSGLLFGTPTVFDVAASPIEFKIITYDMSVLFHTQEFICHYAEQMILRCLFRKGGSSTSLMHLKVLNPNAKEGFEGNHAPSAER